MVYCLVSFGIFSEFMFLFLGGGKGFVVFVLLFGLVSCGVVGYLYYLII